MATARPWRCDVGDSSLGLLRPFAPCPSQGRCYGEDSDRSHRNSKSAPDAFDVRCDQMIAGVGSRCRIGIQTNKIAGTGRL